MTDARFLLDTNICVYLLNGEGDRARERLQTCHRGEVVTSAIVHAEVMLGAVQRERQAVAERFFTQIPVMPFDQAASAAYARLPFSRGKFDRLIAAHALALDLILVTNNERDFTFAPTLAVENWTR